MYGQHNLVLGIFSVNNNKTPILGWGLFFQFLIYIMGLLAILGWVFSVVTSIFLAKGAIDKIRGTEEMVGNFSFMKLDKYRAVTGWGEVLGALLLLYPPTSLYGMVLITSFMSGAVVMHLSAMGGAKVSIPILVGIGSVIGYILRA
jgi:hypothetical protein